jgi:rfaE bifunctional protein kinase chain/domain
VNNQKPKYQRAELKKIFKKFEEFRVLVIGDVMLDQYISGKVSRISPEAPVPIVNVKHNEYRLGGAANVLANLHALNCTPIIASIVGNDNYGTIFCNLLAEKNLSSDGILKVNNRITTIKTRIIGNNHQLLRIDKEQDAPIDAATEKLFLKSVEKILNSQKIDVIIFEDYDKGLLTKTIITKIISLANHLNIPTAVDPKLRNFTCFKNCTLFKPNLKELSEGLKIELNPITPTTLTNAAHKIFQLINPNYLLITLSEKGIYINNQKNHFLLPAHLRNVADVSGAGDTVISVAALCLAAQTDPYLLAELSNIAGGLVCEHLGVVPVNKEQLLSEAFKELC